MNNLIPIVLTIVAFIIFMVLLYTVDDVYESAVETGGLLVLSVLQFSKLLMFEKTDKNPAVEIIDLRVHPIEYLVVFLVSLQLLATLYKWDATTDWPRVLVALFMDESVYIIEFLLKKSLNQLG